MGLQYGITGFKLSPEAAGFASAGGVPAGWSGELTVDAFPDVVQSDTGQLGPYKGNETFYINDPQVRARALEPQETPFLKINIKGCSALSCFRMR